MTHQQVSDQALLDAGFLALREALGPENAYRFVRLLRPGPGDYTEERVLHQGNPTLEELMASIRARRRREAGEQIPPDPPAPVAEGRK